MAESVKVIDPDAGAGYDYDSLFDWEAAQQADIDTSNTIAVAKCRCTGGTADTTRVTIDGWTTSSADYIKIWTDTSETYRHVGTYPTGNKYRLQLSVDYSACIEIYEQYVDLIGIAVYNSSTDRPMAVRVYPDFTSTSNRIRYIQSIFRVNVSANPTSGAYPIIKLQGDYVQCFIINCIIYDLPSVNSGTGIGISTYNGSVWVYNCTIHNCYIGVTRGSFGTVLAKNVGTVCTTGFSGTITQTTCSESTPTFVDEDADDFHLDSADTTWIGEGTNLYNDAVYPFQDDIDSDDRGGAAAAWDIGADEYVSSVSIELEGFRFRNDDGSESAATWKDSQDVNITLAANTSTRIRAILNATGDPASIGAQLEARYKPSGGAFGSWTKVE